ncbi:MAG: Holliday junction resolvase RuvX, partial [Fidelibacterota bacterium]
MAPILAIDYGSRRVGLALSDVRQIIAFPYKTVAYESVDELVKELTSVARDNHVEKIVVGFPVGLKGQRTAQTAEVERFVTTLKRQGALPVVLVDERLSTV